MEMLTVDGITTEVINQSMSLEVIDSASSPEGMKFVTKLQTNKEAGGTILSAALATVMASKLSSPEEALTVLGERDSFEKERLITELGLNKEQLGRVMTSMATAMWIGYQLAVKQLASEIPASKQ